MTGSSAEEYLFFQKGNFNKLGGKRQPLFKDNSSVEEYW